MGRPDLERRETTEGLPRRPALGPAAGRPRPRDPPAADRAGVVRLARRHLRRRGSVDAHQRLLEPRHGRPRRAQRPSPSRRRRCPTAGGRSCRAPGRGLLRRAPGRRARARSGSARPTRRAGASTPWRRSTAPTRPVLPAMELIATVVQASPGNDGIYRARQSSDLIARYLAAARRAHALLILDIQPGRSPLHARGARSYARWLRRAGRRHRARPRVEHGAGAGARDGHRLDRRLDREPRAGLHVPDREGEQPAAEAPDRAPVHDRDDPERPHAPDLPRCRADGQRRRIRRPRRTRSRSTTSSLPGSPAATTGSSSSSTRTPI